MISSCHYSAVPVPNVDESSAQSLDVTAGDLAVSPPTTCYPHEALVAAVVVVADADADADVVAVMMRASLRTTKSVRVATSERDWYHHQLHRLPERSPSLSRPLPRSLPRFDELSLQG